MKRGQSFRIAVRKFDPFESAIRKQWNAFEAVSQTGLTLEAEAFDLIPLTEALFEREGLLRGDWDVAFVNTDWVASIHESRAVVDLSSFLRQNPPDDFPEGLDAFLITTATSRRLCSWSSVSRRARVFDLPKR